MGKRNFSGLTTGPARHDLTLPEGVTVTGRVVKGGKPLAGVPVGLVQKDRNVEAFVGDLKAATDATGTFRIPNAPAEDALVLYGLMDGSKAHGAIPARGVRSGRSGTTLDVGDLEVQKGYTLSGRVVLSDGKPVPAGTRVMLSREEAWDSQQALTGENGSVTLAGVPAERVHMYAALKGYRVSPSNLSFDLLNGGGLLGRVAADTEGLRLLLEPGEWQPPGRPDQTLLEEYNRRADAPLRGAPER
jgi:hypothetical protein